MSKERVARFEPWAQDRELEDKCDEALAQQASYHPGAFAELYRRHLPRIYRYHLARTGCPQDAEDLTAQTFLSAEWMTTQLQSYPPNRSPRSA